MSEARLQPVADPTPDERVVIEQRMARLVEPSRRQSAILVCGLYGAGRLSRELLSATYFRLIRALWSGIGEAVTDECGIVVRQTAEAGSAFFLVEDLGSRSAAAAAAVRAARRIHQVARATTTKSSAVGAMKIALHWGTNVYIGQLVPGGRLDIAALGDEIDEAARLHEVAGPHEAIVSKQLLAQLSGDDAAQLELDVDRITYTLVAELPAAPERTIHEAAGVPVTRL